MNKPYNIDATDIACYKITGYYANTTKKFKTITTTNFILAMSINLWKGNVWLILKNGKRKLIKRI